MFDPTKYKIVESMHMRYLWVPSLFLRPAVLTLVLGILGHQLNIDYLFKLGYWQCFLICWAADILFIRPHPDGWRFELIKSKGIR